MQAKKVFSTSANTFNKELKLGENDRVGHIVPLKARTTFSGIICAPPIASLKGANTCNKKLKLGEHG